MLWNCVFISHEVSPPAFCRSLFSALICTISNLKFATTGVSLIISPMYNFKNSIFPTCQFNYMNNCYFTAEKENERAYKKAIEEQLSVLIHIVRLNFVGLPRSGKSTTMKRLISQILNIMKANLGKEQASSGVSERSQAFIKSTSKSIGFASPSKWSSTDLVGETGVLNQLIQGLVNGKLIWE